MVSDSETCRDWASLDKVPMDIARKIMSLQRFDFDVIHVDGKINMADIFSRQNEAIDPQGKEILPVGTYPRFMEGRLINGEGRRFSWKRLFSAPKSKRMEDFFVRNRKQKLAKAVSIEKEERPMHDDYHPIKDMVDSQIEGEMTVETDKDKSTKTTKECVKEFTCERIMDSLRRNDDDEEDRDSVTDMGNNVTEEGCSVTDDVTPNRNERGSDEEEENERGSDEEEENERGSDEEERKREVQRMNICSFGLTDEEIEGGRNDADDEEMEDIFRDVTLPVYDDDNLEKAKEMQEDETIRKCAQYLRGEEEIPRKINALSLPKDIQTFLRHKLCFRLNEQGILFRLWTHKNGSIDPLLVVGDSQMDRLIAKTHEFDVNCPSGLSHIGQRKTFTAIAKKWYAFRLRFKVNTYISRCASCALNNHITNRARKEDDGEQIACQSGELVVMDFAGPYTMFKTASGLPKYVLIFCDSFSRYAFGTPTNGTNDDYVLEGVMEMRKAWNGLPKSIVCDNALLSKHSATRKFLMDSGVTITHGMANISRCQTKAERLISTISRLIMKYHSSNPKTPFSKLVNESIICYNNSVHSGLGPMTEEGAISPRELHFSPTLKAPLMNIASKEDGKGSKSAKETISLAKRAAEESLLYNVQSFLKKKDHSSPTDYGRRLKSGDLCLLKRTSFAKGIQKKLAFKLQKNAFEVMDRVGTNTFRCKSILTDDICILPGDLLLITRNQTKEDLLRLCERMEEMATKNEASNSPPMTRRRARGAQLSPSIDANFVLNAGLTTKSHYGGIGLDALEWI